MKLQHLKRVWKTSIWDHLKTYPTLLYMGPFESIAYTTHQIQRFNSQMEPTEVRYTMLVVKYVILKHN